MNTYLPRTTRDWFFDEIPTDWAITTLKYACKVFSIYGANIPAEEYVNEGVRFIRTTDITDEGKLLPGGVFIESRMPKIIYWRKMIF